MTTESEERFTALVKRNKNLQFLIVPPIPSSKLKSSSTNSFFSTKLCSSCVQPLGLFLSRGSCCPKCGLKVCKKCKIYEGHSHGWTCLACFKIMKHSRGGIVTNAREESRSAGIKRSFSISETSRSSPVLKSYTKYYEDRPYNSLPRMASQFQNRNENDSHNRGGAHRMSSSRGNILQQKSSLFQSTLHPFCDVHDKKSPTSSVNFIEDEFWDYYDYEFNSQRSSCERSLGETVEYQHCVSEQQGGPPRKPERRKCRSMGAFDAKYSQLKTYCVITKDTGKYSSSLPRKQKRNSSGSSLGNTNEFEKENNSSVRGPATTNSLGRSNNASRAKSVENNKSRAFYESNNVTAKGSPGLRNTSIVTVKQNEGHNEIHPQQQQSSDSSSRNIKDNNKDVWLLNNQVVSTPLIYQIHDSTPININIPMQQESAAAPSSLPHLDQSFHSSLRKNKYLDFYNGLPNKSGGGGLYFSLPPMRDSKESSNPTSTTTKPNSITGIPLKYEDFRLNSKKVFENPGFHILAELKRKSEELEAGVRPRNNQQQNYSSLTLPSPKTKTNAAATSLSPGDKQFDSNRLRGPTRGTIPLFTIPPTKQPQHSHHYSHSSPSSPLHNNTNNKSGGESIFPFSSSSGVGDKSHTTVPAAARREVIILIERECDGDDEKDSTTTPKQQQNNKNNNKNNCRTANEQQLRSTTTTPNVEKQPKPQKPNVNVKAVVTEIESGAEPSSSISVTPYNNTISPIHHVSTATRTATQHKKETIKQNQQNNRKRSGTDKNKKMEEDDDDEVASALSTSASSSTSSFLDPNGESGPDENFGLFCGEEEENEFEFKSCEEEDVEVVEHCSKKKDRVELTVHVGNNGEGILPLGENQVGQFSPAAESSASSGTSSANTGCTVLMPHGLLEGTQAKSENENMVTKTSCSGVLLPIPIISVVNHNPHLQHEGDPNAGATMSSGSSSISGSVVGHKLTPTTKKLFKSRVLVNADDGCDYEDKVEILGDQVGIVTGRGTFIRDSSVEDEEFRNGEDERGKRNPNNDKLLVRGTNSNTTNAISYNNSRKESQGWNPPTGGDMVGESWNNKETRSRSDNKSHLINYNEANATGGKRMGKSNEDLNNLQRRREEVSYEDKLYEIENCKLDKMSSTAKNQNVSLRRESPEGEESAIEKNNKFMDEGGNLKEIPVSAPTRSSPDGADKSSTDDSSPTPNNSLSNPIVEEPLEDEGESTDSWTEEAVFDDDDSDKPPPLDLTLHTIVEESCEESEVEYDDTPKTNKLNDLEKYYNFTTEEPVPYEESEFSDTFSESSLSFDPRNSLELNQVDQFELETGRLEKYFLNLGLSNDSDSVGSESDSECSVLDNRKKVLKHHRRSAEFEDSQVLVSEDDDECAFEQDGLDTIKKQRKLRRSSEDLLDQIPNSSQIHHTILKNESKDLLSSSTHPPTTSTSTSNNDSPPNHNEATPTKETPTTTSSVSRSNSFTWSSDEEVNLMMSKLRHLIKNLVHIKKVDEQKSDKLVYWENELVRLMKHENIKNIVDSISSDSDEDVYKLFERVEGTHQNQPEILNKVMTHIGKRLSTWMRDTDEFTDDGATIKCAPSISSDLNEDRFSWKGSFESTLAKRQSVGSTDSIDGGTSAQEGNELFSERSILRSSSLHHLATSQPILEESEPLASSLPRLNEHPINNRSGISSHQEVKSGRYRPPGYFENMERDMETHVSTPTLSTYSTNKLQDTSRKNITIRGQIEFLMQYNYKCSTFEISIKQCRDLAAVDTKRGRSDPYVKVYLLPERAKSSKKKTKVKKNTLNPLFSEVLKFPVTLEELENRILWLTVWHSGLFGKNEFLGEVLLNLRNITFDDVNYKWFPLQEQRPVESFPPEDQPETKQNLVLSLALKWSPRTFQRGNLTILIKEAKGLKYIKNSCPSTFVKCTPINEKSKKQKTPLCRKTLNPVWNTTLTFENITNDGLEIAFYNYDLLNHELISSTKLDVDCDVWREMGKREGFWVEGVATFATFD